ncbi:MAG: nitrilase family protein [Pirellulales bacterium]|nr:nitrilase family protein [Pirellulales bacterium]
MHDIRIAAAQFEARDADKDYNFGRIEELAQRAVKQGAEIVSFHECCIPGYTFLEDLTRGRLEALAESVPDGPSTRRLVELSDRLDVPLLAGLIERDGPKLYNTYVAVAPRRGLVARHRKIHAFVSEHLSGGDQLEVFELCGVRCGILICYDNNLVENPRIMALNGAEVIFAPHVTCGLPSPMPGRGKIDKRLWDNRQRDPVPLRLQFEGPKGRGWLMRWLPTRAYENGLYYVFTNPVGVDHDTIKTGGAMVIDPFGEIIAESRALGDDVVVGLCTPEKIDLSGGRRYLKARRPELYAKLSEPLPEGQKPEVNPGWRSTGSAQTSDS